MQIDYQIALTLIIRFEVWKLQLIQLNRLTMLQFKTKCFVARFILAECYAG